jgi:hypothetical protein
MPAMISFPVKISEVAKHRLKGQDADALCQIASQNVAKRRKVID